MNDPFLMLRCEMCSEREVRTVKKAAKVMLNKANASKDLLCEAINCAVYTSNRVLNLSVDRRNIFNISIFNILKRPLKARALTDAAISEADLQSSANSSKMFGQWHPISRRPTASTLIRLHHMLLPRLQHNNQCSHLQLPRFSINHEYNRLMHDGRWIQQQIHRQEYSPNV